MEWIRRLTKAFNKFVVSKKNFEDMFLDVERHQPDHPKVAQLKQQYPLVLSGKNIETDATDPAPSKEHTSNETNYEAQDAGANCSTHPTQDEATTSAARDAGADCSANQANNEATTSGERDANANCLAHQAHDEATEKMTNMANTKEQSEGEEQATKEG